MTQWVTETLQSASMGPAALPLAPGIEHRYEEFDDDHSDIDYRMNESLPFLYRSLRP